jgi:restriction endonuclease S subunit
MSEWEETSLGESADWSGGLTPSKSRADFWDGGTIPWISSKEVSGGLSLGTEYKVTQKAIDETSLRVLPEGAVVVVVRSGILARTLPIALVPFMTTINQDVKAAVAKENTSGYFLRLLIEHSAPQILAQYTKTGTTVQSVDVPSLLAHRVWLPPPTEQRRIVEVMSSVDAEIAALEAEYAALKLAYTNAHSLLWTVESGDQADLCRLSDLMTLDIDRVKVDETSTYPIAGVLNAGKGLISRGAILGSGTDYDTLNKMRAGQVVMRKLTAWEGPISVVPDGFDGYFASAEFPTFSLRPGLSARYFDHVCRSRRLLDEMKNRVTGTVQRRKRLNPDQLLDVQLPVPPLPRQEIVADALDAMYGGLAFLTAELAALRRIRSDLLTVLLSQDFTVDEAVEQFVEGAA